LKYSWVILFLLAFASTKSWSQCAFGGTNYGDVTPAGLGQTITLLNFVWGGDQYNLNAVAGCEYTVSMCGTTWDTQITIFDPTLAAVEYNDDFCGLQSQITFTATTTGVYTIQVNTWPCGINFTGAEYFGVTLNSCAAWPGCTDPAACNYDPAATLDDGSCCTDFCVEIGMLDSFGDGWNGAIYSVVNDLGTTVATGSLDLAQTGDGVSTGTDVICLTPGCYTIVVGGGVWDGEITFTVSGGVTTPISGAAGTYTFEVDSGCPPPPVPCYDPDPSGCPDVDAGPDLVVDCTDPCTTTMQVTADPFETGETSTYEVCQIDYNPPYPFTTGIPFSIGVDDIYTGIITLPFNFCFFGNTYNQIVVGSNNVISFDITQASGFCPWAFTASCPSPALPLNSIMGPYHDIDPAVCGDAKWGVYGASPCRTFVVSFDAVCHFLCNSITSTTQIVMYETTNVIEVYIQDKPTCLTWNGGNAVVGIQDATGTQGIAATNRNTGPWSATNEAWRFTPDGAPNYEVNWYEGGVLIGTGETIDVCPSQPTQTYDVTATYTQCDGSTIVVQDDVIVTCQVIMLPVEFLYIEGEALPDRNVVKWGTASEINNDYFEIQRSVDGYQFEALGRVEGMGNSNETQHYVFNDPDRPFGLSYYRIKQVDFNGDFEFSNTITLEHLADFDLISAYPNPFTDEFHVEIRSRKDQIINVKINDPTGRAVVESKYDIGEGVRELDFDTRHLSKGVYQLVIRNEDDVLLTNEKIMRK
jgi:hypothetical protein